MASPTSSWTKPSSTPHENPRGRRYLVQDGSHVDVQKLPVGFDAYAICTGTPTARDLRELKGIYFALDMLAQQNHILDGDTFPKDQLVNARGKRVLVIGGGDTGLTV